jgi:tRNA uridine 5-carbamoylmethylation protein Kti12
MQANKKLLIIFGPPAVGKLTVAEELSKITDFKILNNHADIDILRPIFEFDSQPFKTLSRLFRRSIIEEAVKNNMNLIFTYVWNLNKEGGKKNIDLYKTIVEENGGVV